MLNSVQNENNGLYIELLKKVLTASVYDESAWSIIHAGTPGFAVPPFLRPVIVPLRDILVKVLKKKSLLLVKQRPFNVKERDEGSGWPLFAYTMIGHRRLDNVQFCIEDVLKNNVPGDFIETGVWRGGIIIFMRAMLKAYGITDRKVWAADSFEGLPAPTTINDGWDMSRVDYLKVSLEQVKLNFAKFDLLNEQVKFLPGWFSDTLPHATIEKLAILRLDGDLYTSTMDALQNLYHKVSKGGFVIVDDYYAWPDCKKAVTDFLSANSLQPHIQPIDSIGAYWRV